MLHLPEYTKMPQYLENFNKHAKIFSKAYFMSLKVTGKQRQEYMKMQTNNIFALKKDIKI